MVVDRGAAEASGDQVGAEALGPGMASASAMLVASKALPVRALAAQDPSIPAQS
jgi:hypothetical protein